MAQPGGHGRRCTIVYALSRDDGRSWGEPIVIEDDPETGFSYVAVHFTEEAVLLAYFIEIFTDDGFRRELRMREIRIDELSG